jgi:hypothetical protein
MDTVYYHIAVLFCLGHQACGILNSDGLVNAFLKQALLFINYKQVSTCNLRRKML